MASAHLSSVASVQQDPETSVADKKFEDFAWLNGEQQGMMVMPDLELLETGLSRLEWEVERRVQLAIRQFLMTRTRLKTFGMVSTVPLDPEIVFAQAGMEYEHGWICSELESISLKIQFSSAHGPERRKILMRSQLGCLTRLKHLSIINDCRLEVQCEGIMQLKGATGLEEVTLGFVRDWDDKGFAALMGAVPGLKLLRLMWTSLYIRERIAGWVKDAERPDVKILKL